MKHSYHRYQLGDRVRVYQTSPIPLDGAEGQIIHVVTSGDAHDFSVRLDSGETVHTTQNALVPAYVPLKAPEAEAWHQTRQSVTTMPQPMIAPHQPVMDHTQSVPFKVDDIILTTLGPGKVINTAMTPIGPVYRVLMDSTKDVLDFLEHDVIGKSNGVRHVGSVHEAKVEHTIHLARTKRVSFQLYAAQLEEAAEAAYQKALAMLEPWVTWKAKSLVEESYGDGEISEETATGLAKQRVDRHMAWLHNWFARLPDEAYKAYPWVAREVKRGNLDLDLGSHEASHAADIVGQLGTMLHQMRQRNLKTPDINQMTYEQAEPFVMAERKKLLDVNNGWEERNVVHQFGDGWTIEEVNTKTDLAREGEEMGHCVGGYCHAVEAGDTTIYSLRDPKGGPHATIEIEPTSQSANGQSAGQVIQIQGKGNEDPIAPYKQRIKEWFAAELAKGHSLTLGGGDESSVQNLQGLRYWWERIGNSEYGIPMAPPYVGDIDTVWEEAISSQVHERSNSYHWHGSIEELGKALFILTWADGHDPSEQAQEMAEKTVYEWTSDWYDSDHTEQNERTRVKMDEQFGATHHVVHDSHGEYGALIPHAEAAQYGEEIPDDPEEATDEHRDLYQQEWEEPNYEARDEIHNEWADYYYGDIYKLLGYIHGLATLHPFDKSKPAPNANELSDMSVVNAHHKQLAEERNPAPQSVSIPGAMS